MRGLVDWASRGQLFRRGGVAIVVAIFLLSLLPLSGAPSVPGGDKFHHFLAYGTCMIVWGQAYRAWPTRAKLALIFVAMGALIECFQWLTPYRSFELLDMLANTIGVLIGCATLGLQSFVERQLAAHQAKP